MDVKRLKQNAETKKGIVPFCKVRTVSVCTVCIFCIMFMMIFSCNIVIAQTENSIDDIIKAYMQTYRIPGVEVTISKDNEVVYAKGFGNTPEGEKVTIDTPMYIGSVSKSFTALGVMQLVEEGKIDLDNPIIDYLPWFRVDDINSTNTITIRHLLNHTSGLSDATYFSRFSPDTTVKASVEHLKYAKPVAVPGSTYHYFNQNYQILGLIIEEASGLSYGEYVKQNILKPLSMENTYVDKEEIEKVITRGHSALFGFPIKMKEPFSEYSLPDGGIVSTANDMIKFLMSHKVNSIDSENKLLSDEGYNQIFTPNTSIGSNEGMGCEINKSKNGYTVIHQGGDLDTYHAYTVIIPEKSICIVLLVNQNNYIYTSNVYISLVKALINNTTDNGVVEDMPYFNIYLILAAVLVLVIIVQAIYSIVKLLKKGMKLKSEKRVWRYFYIIRGLIVPVVLLVILPIYISYNMNRGFDAIELYRMQPDFTLSIVSISILYILKTIVKLVVYIKNK